MIARRPVLLALVWLCMVAGALVWSGAPALGQRLHEFSKSFGSEGSGDGQLMRPGALAVNEETGNVYVLDRGNGRVEEFGSMGAYVGQFNGSASPTGAFSWPSSSEMPEGAIAVDNSTNPLDPSRGDVYVLDTGHHVIDKFTSGGAYIGQVVGASPSSPFDGSSNVIGITVDSNGGLWVQRPANEIDQFNDASANEYVSAFEAKIRDEGTQRGGGLNHVGFAFDSEGNFYVGEDTGEEPLIFPAEFSKTGEVLAEKLDDEETTGLGVDLSSDDVYVDHATSVAAYGPSATSIERFGSARMQESEGIAVNSSTGAVYTSDVATQGIDLFTAFVVPDATTGSASSFAETSVTVGGVVNPDGLPVTSCVFEYGTTESYGQSMPCSPSPGSGSDPETVSARLEGLERLAKYHFRLSVANANGANQGQDRTFVTPEPVGLSEESVSDVSSTSALFSSQVDPHGADTTYHFEYGTSVSYGESLPAPPGDLGAGTSSVVAAVRAQNLTPETTYHLRVVASNVLGTVYGPDQTFTTQAGGGAFVLPDGRAWEMVSPPAKEGLIEPIGGGIFASGGLIESSVEGSAVSYYANGPVGVNTAGNPAPTGPVQVLSRRGTGGWSSEDIALPRSKASGEQAFPEYYFFSSDLSQALVEQFHTAPLSAEATEATPYLRDNDTGSYVPLVTANNVEPRGTKFGSDVVDENPRAIAATSDLSHVLFMSLDALTSTALNLHGEADSEGNIYEWSGGRLQLASALPGGSAARSPVLGGYKQFEGGLNAEHALSSDGSRVFFTEALGGAIEGPLYMHDTITDQTVQVDAAAPGVSPPPDNRAVFQIASADGSKVFFTDEQPLTLDSRLRPQGAHEGDGISDLYECQIVEEAGGLKCGLTDLSVDQNAGEAANVQDEVVGASEDGSIVYFVATGVLASGAKSGKDNLYVESETGSSWSAPRLVAVLSEEDGYAWGIKPSSSGGGGRTGGEQSHASRVSASGRYLAFMSQQSLTGYDNRDANSGEPDEEVFLYDETTGRLTCVSCNPTGARPDGVFDAAAMTLLIDAGNSSLFVGRWLAASIPGWTSVERGFGVFYQSRVLSDEGRMFFDSADALVPQDTNGREDVYEYEPQGVGSCARGGGCVSLISSGTSSEESAFLDASGKGPGGEEGEDVFFLTASSLASQDVDTAFDVYDAHVCSAASPCVSAPVSPPPCTSGDSCKAAPLLQPAIFGAPSSATFSGAGNVIPPTPAAVKPRPKSKPVRCRKGFVKKKGKCVRKPKLKKAKKSAKGRR